MLNEKKVLGVVPARGGSKGIPRKNLREIGGIPLVGYAVVAAACVPEIDCVLLSTEDPEIANAGRKFGAETPFMRPVNLSGDDTPIIDVLVDILDRLSRGGQNYDYICLFQPTTPFRDPETISAALKYIDQHPEADSCIALTPVVDFHPKRIRRIVDGYVEGYLGQEADSERQQRQFHQTDPAYRRCGTFYISRRETIIEKRSVFGKHILPMVVEGCQSITIDEPFDLLLADAVWNKREEFLELATLCKALKK